MKPSLLPCRWITSTITVPFCHVAEILPPPPSPSYPQDNDTTTLMIINALDIIKMTDFFNVVILSSLISFINIRATPDSLIKLYNERKTDSENNIHYGRIFLTTRDLRDQVTKHPQASIFKKWYKPLLFINTFLTKFELQYKRFYVDMTTYC